MATNKYPNLNSVIKVNLAGVYYVLHPADVSGKFALAPRIVTFFLLAI